MGLATVATGKQFGYLPQGPIFGFEITAPENRMDEEPTKEALSVPKKQNAEEESEKIESTALNGFQVGFSKNKDEQQVFDHPKERQSSFLVFADTIKEKTKEIEGEQVLVSPESRNKEEDENYFTVSKDKNVVLKRSGILENSLDMLTKLFPNKKRSVLELVLKRCGDDLIKAIEEIVPKTIDQSNGNDVSGHNRSTEQEDIASKTSENLMTQKNESDQSNPLFFHKDQTSAFKPFVPKISNFAEKPKLRDLSQIKMKNSETLLKHQIDLKGRLSLEHLPKNGHLSQIIGSTNSSFPSFGSYIEGGEILKPGNYGLPFGSSNIGFGHNSMSTALLALGGPGFNFGCTLNNFHNFQSFNNGISISNAQGFPNHFGVLTNLAGHNNHLRSNDFFLHLPNHENIKKVELETQRSVSYYTDMIHGDEKVGVDDLSANRKNECV